MFILMLNQHRLHSTIIITMFISVLCKKKKPLFPHYISAIFVSAFCQCNLCPNSMHCFSVCQCNLYPNSMQCFSVLSIQCLSRRFIKAVPYLSVLTMQSLSQRFAIQSLSLLFQRFVNAIFESVFCQCSLCPSVLSM